MGWSPLDLNKFLSQANYPEPPILREKEGDLSKCGTKVDAYPEERTQKTSTEQLSETGSGSQNMVLRVLKRCQMLPTAIQ